MNSTAINCLKPASLLASMVCFFCTLPCPADAKNASSAHAEDRVIPAESPTQFLKRMKPVLAHEELVKKVNAALEQITVPAVSYKNLPLAEVIADINKQLRAHNAKPGAIQIPRLRESPEFIELRAELLRHHEITEAEKDLPVSLSLTGVPMKPLIDYFSQQTGNSAEIKTDGIWLKPVCTINTSLVTGAYQLPNALASTQKQAADIIYGLFPEFKKNPELGFEFHFVQSTNTLVLRASDTTIREFESWYAHQLLKLGYKIPKG
jgi:hypothetical protein